MIEHAPAASHIPHELTPDELRALDGAVVTLSDRRVLRLIDPVESPNGGVDVEVVLISDEDRSSLGRTGVGPLCPRRDGDTPHSGLGEDRRGLAAGAGEALDDQDHVVAGVVGLEPGEEAIGDALDGVAVEGQRRSGEPVEPGVERLGTSLDQAVAVHHEEVAVARGTGGVPARPTEVDAQRRPGGAVEPDRFAVADDAAPGGVPPGSR